MLLLLTVKNKQKRVGPQPPQKLQFHVSFIELEEEKRPPRRIGDLEEGAFQEVNIDDDVAGPNQRDMENEIRVLETDVVHI